MTIDKKVVEELQSWLGEGRTILEIGTGLGTELLAEHWKVYSIEHNAQWHRGVSELVPVPLVDIRDHIDPTCRSFWKRFPEATEWYDPEVLEKVLPKLQYDVILVDGPPGGAKRAAMWWYYRRLPFDKTARVIVDDVHRRYDWQVTCEIARVKGVEDFKVSVVSSKMFAVIR
jgi:hypothetical protein